MHNNIKFKGRVKISIHKIINLLENNQNRNAYNETIINEDLSQCPLPNKRFISVRYHKEVNRTPLFDAILKHRSDRKTYEAIKSNLVECDVNDNYYMGLEI